jgi:superfamily II DNA or RNA helicase
LGSELIVIKKINEVFVKVFCDYSVAREISERFSFEIPNARFHPKVKAGVWDGVIRLLNLKTGQIYLGLLDKLLEFAKEKNYQVEFDGDFGKENFSVHEAKEFIKTLNLPNFIEIRDYQIEAFVHCVRERRALSLLPTSSGKSLLLYWLIRYFQDQKTLIIVPTVNLVNQLFKDFKDYGWDSEENIHKIFSGQEKETQKKCIISTYQSMAKLPPSYLKKFGHIIVDECHTAKSKSITSILESMPNTRYRFGFTGTLDGTETNENTLRGLFGEVKRFITTSELIEQGYATPVRVKGLVLNYKEIPQKYLRGLDWDGENEVIHGYEKRHKFIANLALSIKGNTFVMFRIISHGEELYRLINEMNTENRKILLVHGQLDKEGKETRNNLKEILAKETNAIVVASFGTSSTGLNVPALDNIIFTTSYKNQIKVLQSIGRILRKAAGKNIATLYDIADNFNIKNKPNILIRHFFERIKMYAEEKFPYKIYEVSL